jgi:hypothetical protein
MIAEIGRRLGQLQLKGSAILGTQLLRESAGQSLDTGTATLIDVAMRDYLSVREEMAGLRRLSSSIFTGAIAAVAVGLSGVAALADKNSGPEAWSLALLAAALIIELASIVLIGIDGSFKVAEDLNRRQAQEIRELLKQISPLPVSDAVLGFQITANEIWSEAPSRVWLASYGAWSVEGLILPGLAIALAGTGASAGLSSTVGLSVPAWSLAAIDVALGFAIAGAIVLDVGLPARLELRRKKQSQSRVELDRAQGAPSRLEGDPALNGSGPEASASGRRSGDEGERPPSRRASDRRRAIGVLAEPPTPAPAHPKASLTSGRSSTRSSGGPAPTKPHGGTT